MLASAERRQTRTSSAACTALRRPRRHGRLCTPLLTAPLCALLLSQFGMGKAKGVARKQRKERKNKMKKKRGVKKVGAK